MKRVLWTKAEIEQLKQLVGKMPYTEIGKKLGRSEDAIKNKMMTLNKRIELPAVDSRPPMIQLYKNPHRRDFHVKAETVSTLQWCPTCHAPVSNWEEHRERTKCPKPSN